MSFIDTLTKSLGFNEEFKKRQPIPSVGNKNIVSQPPSFLQTLSKNLHIDTLPVPTLSTPKKTPSFQATLYEGLNKQQTQKAKEVLQTPSGVKTPFLTDIGQSTARNIASAGLTLSTAIQGKPADELKLEDIPVQSWNTFLSIFGDEFAGKPIKSLEQRVVEAEPGIKQWGAEIANDSTQNPKVRKFGGFVERNPTLFAVSGIVGSAGLDLTPFGGSAKTAARSFIPITTIGDALIHARKLGFSDDIAKNFAEEIVKTNTDEGAEKLFNSMVEMQTTTKAPVLRHAVSGEQFNILEKGPEVSKVKSLKTGEELHIDNVDLASKFIPEVKKENNIGFHKSPEGKNMTEVDPNRLTEGELGTGFYFSRNNKKYEEFLQPREGIDTNLADTKSFSLEDFNTKKITRDEYVKEFREATGSKSPKENLIDQYKKEGYDGYEITNEEQGIIFKEAVDRVKFNNNIEKERKFITSIKESPQIKDELKDVVQGTYAPITNKETLEASQKAVKEDATKALADVMEGTTMNSEYTGKALVLIHEAQKVGDYEMAARIAERSAQKLTEAGQMVQAANMLNRLTPEGVLVYASRRTGKKLTPELTEKLTAQAKKIQELPSGYEKFKETQKLGEIISHEIPSSLSSKAKDWLFELINIPRSIASSFFDFSFGLRQGIVAGPSFPKQFGGAFKAQFKPFGSEKAYGELMDSVINHPRFEQASQSGLAFSDINLKLGAREEKYMSSWAEKIPIIGIPIRATNRAYTAMANKLRMDVFDNMISNFEKSGVEVSDKVLRDTASFVNDLTGRGNLPNILENASKLLNSVFYSPRLMASRLNLLANPVKYIKQSPAVRKQALVSMLAFGGTVATILGLVDRIPGVNVETDMRSADWGKIKTGNTRVDIMGGFQQYVRMAAQLISGKYVNSATGKVITLGEGYNPMTRYDILFKGLESKEAPLFSLLTTLLKGQDFQGNKVKPLQEIGKKFIPMLASDIIDVAKDDPKLLPLGILAAFGTGLQTYPPPEAYVKLNEINNLPKSEQAEAFNQLKHDNPKLAEKVKLAKTEEAFTEFDWGLTYMGVENGKRAEFLMNYFNKLPDNKARAAAYNDLRKKKLISDRVADQIKFLKENPNYEIPSK